MFTISFLNSVSIRLQRSVSLFAPMEEFSYFFDWKYFMSFFILITFFLFCEFRENNYCSFGGLLTCESTPGYFEVLLFIFAMRTTFDLDACCLFLQCVQAIILLIALASRERAATGKASTSAWLLSPCQ